MPHGRLQALVFFRNFVVFRFGLLLSFVSGFVFFSYSFFGCVTNNSLKEFSHTKLSLMN